MDLKHVVITTVTRDDLADGGASHFVAVIQELRKSVPDAEIEVLTSDFAGALDCVDRVLEAGPDVFNHNIETVPRLYSAIRPEAEYDRSLAVLARAQERPASSAERSIPTKSGLMLGLGEETDEVLAVMEDLRDIGVSMLTLGQYLRPSKNHLPVAEFVEPDTFAELARAGYRMGFDSVSSAPFVRSSYHAHEMVQETRR
jgi:lipoic acid synthetase